MRRGGQGLFLPRAVWKQREKTSVGHILFSLPAADVPKRILKPLFLREARGTDRA
ncbi:hypothetical protein [Bacillus multifaciens]|uniref:hypothetical protein n=1 Tax=Bacillus multifaciens TaxID=3068506 RepID=UPI0027425327|nr:hypothetical protein [Bacillus sp. WLY-B-L8]MDP7979022.1 hypothetical protein [Bacillus sp. WLY-B-L8]